MDLINLEMHLSNCANHPNPVRKFREFVQKKMGGTFSPIPQDQANTSEYVIQV